MSTQDRPLLTWLHLSDLHFGHGPTAHGWNQMLVLDTLRTTVEEARSKGEWPPIDLILVTGDVAFSGGGRPGQAGKANDEYQRAADWLNQVAADAGLRPEAVFVVPGNHDVDRSRDQDRDTRRLIESLRADASIDEALADPGDREKLCSRQEHYLEFARSWAEPCRAGDLYWSHRGTSPRGLSYRLAGLNTALLCADGEDRGKLAAGNEQLVRLFVDEPIAGEELVIVLSHHPLPSGWLADERGIWDQVRARAHLHLSGHLHEAHSAWSQTGSGDEIVTVVAGAAHAEAGHSTHGFNLSSVIRRSDGAPAVEVRPFIWSKNRFVVDYNNLPTDCDRATHGLRLAPKTVPPVEDEPPTPTPAGELRQEVHDDLRRIFAGDAALASCFAAEYGSSEPEALAQALSSAPLAESLGRFFSVYDRCTRLQSGSGFREVIAVILRLATQWDTVCRWRESHADGDRRFRLAQFRKHYLVQIAARLIQGSRRLGLEPGERSAPQAPDVVEPGLDPGTDREFAQAELESMLWERAMGSPLERYDPHEHRQELEGHLQALADQKRGLVVLIDESRPAVRPDVAARIPAILLFERSEDGETCFLIDEFRLGRLLNDILPPDRSPDMNHGTRGPKP